MKKQIILLFTVLLASTAPAQKVKLELNLKKDHVYTQKIVSKSSNIITIDGKQFTTNTTICTKYAYKVTDIQDTAYTLQVKYLILSMNSGTGGDGTFTSFSSEDKAAKDNFSKALSSMTNKPFYMRITKSWKVLEVKDFESILKAVSQEFVEMTDAEKEKMQKQILPLFGEDALTKAMQEHYNFFPNAPVGKGEQWTATSSNKLFLPYLTTSTFELKEINQNSYNITGKSDFSTGQDINTMDIMGIKMFGSLSGKKTEDIKVDKKTGWIIERKSTQTGQGTFKAKKDSGSEKSIDLSMSINGETTITQE